MGVMRKVVVIKARPFSLTLILTILAAVAMGCYQANLRRISCCFCVNLSKKGGAFKMVVLYFAQI